MWAKTVLILTALGAVSGGNKMSYELFAKLHARIVERHAQARDLEDELPGLAGRLKIAEKVSADYWTDSTPFDELAKSYILPDAVLDALAIPRATTHGLVHVPAGVMHTYGYLFSQLRTAFGLKGKRWIESRLDERLGLPAGAFSVLPPKGEFLSNVTRAFFKVLGVSAGLPRAAALSPKTRLTGTITEQVVWKTGDGAVKRGVVRTHLVDLLPLKDQQTTDVKLLIYEAELDGRRRLVTGFPVDEKFATSIVASGPATDTVFKPRFNLYVDPSWSVLEHRSEGFVSAKP
ncbi:MAG: hypothetical protein HY075_13240 [Deltaproteobacteria bacterium]|nr:hypothetical protein [Deltaproteobacteria bacterium]